MALSLDDFDVVVFDLDGTIYNGDTLIRNADRIVEFFRKQDKIIIFGTNNSGKSRKDIAEKLNNLNVSCLNEDEVVNSLFLASLYLKEHCINNLYVIGSSALKSELLSNGISLQDEKHAKNILVGFTKSIDYELLSIAFRVALKADNIYFCNEDKYYPASDGTLFPGCGYLTSMIKWCTSRNDFINIGKPNTYMLEYISKKYNVINSRILCIGDFLETDYKMAKDYCSKCILINGNGCIDKEIIRNDTNQFVSVNEIGDILNLFSKKE